MARRRVLPLPDESVRYILAHVDDLRTSFPPERGYGPFLAAFVRLIYQATGSVYGATITRKLLQTYAPECTPSTTTIHNELLALRQQLHDYPDSLQPEVVPGAPAATVALSPFVTQPVEANKQRRSGSGGGTAELGNLTAMIAGLQRSLSTATMAAPPRHVVQQDNALAMALEAENQRLRTRTEHIESQLTIALKEREQALLSLEEARAQRDALQSMVEDLTARVESLAQAVDLAQQRTGASHKFAMGRIEDATGEVRLYKDLLANERAKTEAVKKDLDAERDMSNALRQALNRMKERGTHDQ